MSDRDAKIIDAALRSFTRYGVAKTTMHDIAQEAGVARQTLYNAYPGKEQVLRATVKSVATRNYHDVMHDWAIAGSLQEKLDIFIRRVPLHWYDQTQQAPDAAELINGLHQVAAEELRQMDAIWIDAFADLIAGHIKGTPGLRDLADFIYTSGINAKYGVENRAALEARLQVWKTAALGLIGET
ncbi:TetR/AcrR family transcriptional regulator [Yoonia sp. 2307UL14-13]|uniref:TetR/AcrR family transcriptional regulator n=1 Tax=Yoonia sp. 2307UL14-13 TaxID=3126506 RepID=UPI00309BC0D2